MQAAAKLLPEQSNVICQRYATSSLCTHFREQMRALGYQVPHCPCAFARSYPLQAWEDDHQGVTNSAEEQVVAEMGVYENYIIGMLTNMQAMTLERLHQTLKVFSVNPKYDKTQEQLAAFMAVLEARDKVVLTNGVYKRKIAA